VKPFLYLAGPYSRDPGFYVKLAEAWYTQLIQEGFYVFCPHLSHYPNEIRPLPYKTWMEQDIAWLEKCDVLFRFSTDKSPGADQEVLHAIAKQIPHFTSHALLMEWREAWDGRKKQS